MDAETTASYDAAGYGRISEPGNKLALVVVDMCLAYFDAESPLDLGQPAVAVAVKDLIDTARAAEISVFWTRVEFPPGGDGGSWYEKVPALSSFDADSRLADWVPGLEPGDGEVVFTKQHASGFFGTGLHDALIADSVDTVIICGVSTSGCVRATATDASAHGYISFVVDEAVGDRTPAVHEANLFDLHAKYADVISLKNAKQTVASFTHL